MIPRLIDKLIFGATLICALQASLLADHYQQFLSGLYESTKWQVEGYQNTAKQHEYSDVLSMIEHHLKNEIPSVKTDAKQKLVTLEFYEELANGIAIFEDGNILEKSIYMFNPTRSQYLKKTINNFTVGIPLSIDGWIFGVIMGLILNLLVTLPFRLFRKPKNTHP